MFLSRHNGANLVIDHAMRILVLMFLLATSLHAFESLEEFEYSLENQHELDKYQRKLGGVEKLAVLRNLIRQLSGGAPIGYRFEASRTIYFAIGSIDSKDPDVLHLKILARNRMEALRAVCERRRVA